MDKDYFKRIIDVFWEQYIKSRSPSKWLYDKSGMGNHHSLLLLWEEFLEDEEKLKNMFWSNDNLDVAPTHIFSKYYEDRYDGSDIFLNRCVGYLCAFLFRARNIVYGSGVTVGTRVNGSNFKIANGQTYRSVEEAV